MDLVSSISTVGFPIVAYLLVYLDLRKYIKENTAATRELSQYIKNGRT